MKLTIFIHIKVPRQGTCVDEVAEWLRRWTANPLGSPRVGSNPILVEKFCLQSDGTDVLHHDKQYVLIFRHLGYFLFFLDEDQKVIDR